MTDLYSAFVLNRSGSMGPKMSDAIDRGREPGAYATSSVADGSIDWNGGPTR